MNVHFQGWGQMIKHEDGYVEFAHRVEYPYWHKKVDFKACDCPEQELRAAAEHLAGQHIVLGAFVHSAICIYTKEADCPREIMLFMARNSLTKITALGFLHFLRHLSEDSGVLLNVNPIRPGATHFNWRLIQQDGLVKGTRYRLPILRCGALMFDNSSNGEFLSCIARFYSHCCVLYEVSLPKQLEDVPKAMENSGMGNVGPVVRLQFQGLINTQAINSLIRYFHQECAFDLRRYVPHVVFPRVKGEWPDACPRAAPVLVPSAKEVRSRVSGSRRGYLLHIWDEGMEIREYHLDNVVTGAKFRVRLLSRVSGIFEFHLLFSDLTCL